jgi:hypothetical protein
VLREMGHQGGTVGGAAFGVAERVKFQGDSAFETEGGQDVPPAGNHLGIGQRFGGADQLQADLVELAGAAFLWALVSEHRSGIEHLLGQRLGEAVGNQGTADAGSAFRAQGQAFTAAIGKAVHLLGDDVRGLSQGAGEDGGLLKDRCCPLVESVKAGGAARGLDDVAVTAMIPGE